MKQHLFEVDYSSDFVRWSIVYETIKDIKIKDGYNPILEDVQNNIILNNDSALAYFFASDIGYKTYRMQNLILKTKEPKYLYLFALNIRNADISALQASILESKKIKYICKFGCFVNGADTRKIEKFILNTKGAKAKYAHMLIKHVEGVKVNKFKDIIIKSKKPRYLFELAKHLKNKKELSLIEDIIIERKSKTYIKMFAEKIKNSNVEKLEQAILDLEDVEEIKKFAKYVKKSKMKNFTIMF